MNNCRPRSRVWLRSRRSSLALVERLEELEEDVGYFVRQAGTLLQWHWTLNPRYRRAYQIQRLDRVLQLLIRTDRYSPQRRLLELKKLERDFQDLRDQLEREKPRRPQSP